MYLIKKINVLQSLFFLVLLVGYLLTFTSTSSAKEVVIGLRVIQGVDTGLKQWQATADFLSERIDDYTFKLVPFDKLNDLSAAAERGELDYVITNPASYVEMEMLYGASRILTLINKRQGKPYTQFGSVIFTRADHSNIKSFDDLRGKTLMAVSEPAFGGWLVAWGELLKHGIDPGKDLKKLMFAGGNQQDVVFAVRDGKADVGVVRTDMLERMAESGLINLNDFRNIGQRDSKDFPFMRSTDLYPEWAFAQFQKAPTGLSRKIVHALLEMSPDHAAAKAGNYVGWSVPLNYQPVHDLLRTLKIGPYKDYGKVTLKDTLLTYRYWITAIVAILLVLFATGSFALTRSRQLAHLRSSMLSDKKRELDFQRLALDEHAIVSITDVKGNITYVNDKFCDISGYTREELLGQNHRILQSGEHSPEFYEDLWQTIANGIPWHGEIKDLKKGEDYYWSKATIVPFLDEQGKPFQYVAIRTDITERKEIEEALKIAKDKAEEASRTKSEFMQSMSHELRTPMNAILGFTQMLERNPKEPLTERQQKNVNYVLQGGYHLLRLIEELLELNEIDAGQLSLTVEHVPARHVIDECLPQVKLRVEENNLKIIDTTSENDLPLLWTDETRLKQVLLNLLTNAVKYTRPGGTVTISSQETPNHMLRISVADTGEGIPADKQKNLFVVFDRLGRETGTIEGTGIGLTMAKRIIEVLGGTIGFESEEGKGSTFWIDIPMSEKQDIDAANVKIAKSTGKANKKPGEAGSQYSVLYLEDVPANLALMEMIIGKFNDIKLLTAHNAELGLDLARQFKPDLILMDIDLPGMNGIEALGQLQKTLETKDIPVIALTANAMAKEVEAGIKAGFKAYITKPINVQETLQVINDALSGG